MPRKPLSDEQRAARREADRQKTREAVEALTTSDGWRNWLAVRRHFHRYSLSNQLLIAMQMPEATRVAGFRAWLKLGYCVRRGEHALKIWMPIPPSKRKLDEWKAAVADPKAKPRTNFRLGHVFDRSQVEELPPPAEPLPLDPPMREIAADDLASAREPLLGLGRQHACVVLLGTEGVAGQQQRRLRSATASASTHTTMMLFRKLGHAPIDAPMASMRSLTPRKHSVSRPPLHRLASERDLLVE